MLGIAQLTFFDGVLCLLESINTYKYSGIEIHQCLLLNYQMSFG